MMHPQLGFPIAQFLLHRHDPFSHHHDDDDDPFSWDIETCSSDLKFKKFLAIALKSTFTLTDLIAWALVGVSAFPLVVLEILARY